MFETPRRSATVLNAWSGSLEDLQQQAQLVSPVSSDNTGKKKKTKPPQRSVSVPQLFALEDAADSEAEGRRTGEKCHTERDDEESILRGVDSAKVTVLEIEGSGTDLKSTAGTSNISIGLPNHSISG
ncbi:UNVERIFIED_CONTAM: hypothetical protein FKN15_000165 [Acipenser sinensis]